MILPQRHWPTLMDILWKASAEWSLTTAGTALSTFWLQTNISLPLHRIQHILSLLEGICWYAWKYLRNKKFWESHECCHIRKPTFPLSTYLLAQCIPQSYSTVYPSVSYTVLLHTVSSETCERQSSAFKPMGDGRIYSKAVPVVAVHLAIQREWPRKWKGLQKLDRRGELNSRNL